MLQAEGKPVREPRAGSCGQSGAWQGGGAQLCCNGRCLWTTCTASRVLGHRSGIRTSCGDASEGVLLRAGPPGSRLYDWHQNCPL